MTKTGKGKLTKHDMIEAILKKGRVSKGDSLSLTDVLLHVKKKLKLKTFGQQLIMITAAWNWKKDDLRLQPKYCIQLVYYFYFC